MRIWLSLHGLRLAATLILVVASLQEHSCAPTSPSFAPGETIILDEGQSEYDIGIGIADVTGPAAGVALMGYGTFNQIDEGIHTRLFSRAFIIGGRNSRVVFVSVDLGMITKLIKYEVIEKLRKKFGSLYTQENVMLSATHTHSGPGGYFQYFLFQITNLGVVKKSLDAVVDGIVRSIWKAHHNIQKGKIYFTQGYLNNANINRSPTAYEQNPAEERAKYKSNVSKDVYQINFTDQQGNPIGLINFFAVHGTSMNNSNTLVSSDNKGYAALLFEKRMNPGRMPGKGPFVAAFASSNLGDASPNTAGTRCIESGEPCDSESSTCPDTNQMCVGVGPGADMFDSTRIIGERQFKKTLELFNVRNQTRVSGSIVFVQEYANMTDDEMTCKPAMGYSFAAGAIDGPSGLAYVAQGMKHGTFLWDIVRNLLHRPSKAQVDCHYPKPILLDTGEILSPYPWQAEVVDTQILKIGQLLIIGLPGEFTTMSGRRIIEAIRGQNNSSSDEVVILAGLANTYADYVTTFEEYQVQRYEGASTIFGPHTLEAYIKQYLRLVSALKKGRSILMKSIPPNLSKNLVSLLPGVFFDTASGGKSFGDSLIHIPDDVHVGDTVQAEFVSGHPRNNLMQEKTFLTVERQADDNNDSWAIVATDASWETKFIWKRHSVFSGDSRATIVWNIPSDTLPGTYRIRHFGYYKKFWGGTIPYSGTSNIFRVHLQSIRQFSFARLFQDFNGIR